MARHGHHHHRFLTMFPILIQRSICALLNAHSFFSGSPAIPCIPRSSGDLLSTVNQAISTIGACLVVGPADGSFVRKETASATINGLYTLTAIESVEINRSNAGTRQVAEAISWAASCVLINQILRHPETGADLTGGPVILEGFADAEVTTKEHGMRLISELTIRVIGGSPAAESTRLTRL